MIPIVIVHRIVEHQVASINPVQAGLSILAIIISIGSASSQFFQWYLGGRRVSVTAGQGVIVFSANDYRSCLILSATNHGRIAAVIKQWGFHIPREAYTLGPGQGMWSHGKNLPITLKPGDSKIW